MYRHSEHVRRESPRSEFSHSYDEPFYSGHDAAYESHHEGPIVRPYSDYHVVSEEPIVDQHWTKHVPASSQESRQAIIERDLREIERLTHEEQQDRHSYSHHEPREHYVEQSESEEESEPEPAEKKSKKDKDKSSKGKKKEKAKYAGRADMRKPQEEPVRRTWKRAKPLEEIHREETPISRGVWADPARIESKKE